MTGKKCTFALNEKMNVKNPVLPLIRLMHWQRSLWNFEKNTKQILISHVVQNNSFYTKNNVQSAAGRVTEVVDIYYRNIWLHPIIRDDNVLRKLCQHIRPIQSTLIMFSNSTELDQTLRSGSTLFEMLL